MDATATYEVTAQSTVTLNAEEGINSEDVEITDEAPFPLDKETPSVVKLESIESVQSTPQTVTPVESEITRCQEQPEVVSREDDAGTIEKTTENINKEDHPLENGKASEPNESPTPKRKKTDRESLISRMMKKAKISVTIVTTRHYRCRICFISMSCPSELTAHVKLVHNLRFEGSPIVQPCEESEDGNQGLSAAMRNLSNILEESERMGQHIEDEKLRLEKATTKGKKPVDKHFRCRFCFIDFKFNEELSHHMALHAQKKIVSCKNCGMFFSTEYTLKKHAQKDSDEGTIHKCTENKCNSGFSNRKCFLFHLTTHDGLHRCPTCEKTFEFSDEVLQHVTDVHILNKIDPSTAVDISEANGVGKTVHKKVPGKQGKVPGKQGKVPGKQGTVPGKQGKVPCDQCGGKLFSNIARHLRDCHYKFKCPVCNKGSSSQVNLNQHLSRMHPKYVAPDIETIVIPKKLLDSKRPFQCDLCSKSYTHLCYLSRHYNFDHGSKKKLRLVAESEPETADEAEEPVETDPEQFDEDSQTSSEDENKKKSEFPNIPRDELGRYKCPRCGPSSDKTFATKDSVYRHLRRIHKQVSLGYKRPVPDQTDTDEEDDQKTKERCAVCRYRLANPWSLGRHINSFHPNYPNPDSPVKRKIPKPKQKGISKRLKKAKVSSEEEVDEESSESQEDDEPIIPQKIEEPALHEVLESAESDLDEDNYEIVAPPESEKSDISSDDEDVDPDPSVTDNGVNKPPYRCQQCTGKYTQLWNLNRHEKLHHRNITILDEDKNRILVPYSGGPVSKYACGVKRRRGGRRGRGGYPGSIGRPRKSLADRSSVEESVDVNSSEEVVVKTELDSSMEPTDASESSKVPSASKDVTSTPAGPRRLTRSSRSLEPALPQLHESDSSEEESDSDSEDDRPKQKTEQKKCVQSLKCPKLLSSMNIVTRHLRADHLMDEMSIVIFSMLFGSYRCPFCKRPFNLPRDEETRYAQLREHIELKHPDMQFPSPEEIQKRKEEMRIEMEPENSLSRVSKSRNRLGSSLPVVKVMKMDIDQEAKAIDGNSQILSISSDKLTESMVDDSCTSSSDNIFKQNSPQNTGETIGGKLNDFVESESSEGCVQVPSALNVEAIDRAGEEIDVKSSLQKLSESEGQDVQLEPESESSQIKEEIVQNTELNSDSELPVFSNSVILHMDIPSESMHHTTEEEEELNQPTTSTTDAIKEEPCSFVAEADTDIPSSEDLLSLPETETLTEKKPLVFNVTIPQIKLSSSTERLSSTPKTKTYAEMTNNQEIASKDGQAGSSEDIIIIGEVMKVEENDEKPSHSKKPSAAQPPLKKELRDLGSPTETPKPLPVTVEKPGTSKTFETKRIQPPLKKEPRDLGSPTDVPKPLPVTIEKPGTSKSFETKRIHPERMMIIKKPSVSSHTTPTPVVVRRLSDLMRPGDPKLPAVVSIQPKALGGFSSAQRVRLISHQSVLFRCSVCHQVFQSKKDMLTHLTKTHTLQALHSATATSDAKDPS